MDFTHFNFYLSHSRLLVDSTRKQHPRILKTDGYNELFDLPDTGGIVRNIVADCTILEVEYVFIRKLLREGYPVVAGDIRKIPFEDNTFDGILDLSTIDHVSKNDVYGVMQEYSRVLKPGGRLLLVAWMAENPMVRDETERRGHTWTSLNQYFFDPVDFKDNLSSLFAIESIERVPIGSPNDDSYLLAYTATVRKTA